MSERMSHESLDRETELESRILRARTDRTRASVSHEISLLRFVMNTVSEVVSFRTMIWVCVLLFIVLPPLWTQVARQNSRKDITQKKAC